MIIVDDKKTEISGDDFEVYSSLVHLRAAIVQEPWLMELDQAAMRCVEAALKDGIIKQIASSDDDKRFLKDDEKA